jgi:peptidoglycan/xylan/chitin deacetylase (PgdA/CDA1 family)
MSRILSFRFDDGLRRGAERSNKLLGSWRATYFVVSGWAAGQKPRWPELRDCDFGDLEFWKGMRDCGHDVQSHSDSHPNFREISAEAATGEIERSAAFIRQIHPKGLVFCYPFNAISNLCLAAAGFNAGGFDTTSSDEPVAYNTRGVQNVFRLNSWAVRERHYARVVEALSSDVPDGAWVILAFHSLDGEGHEPWSSRGFQRLVQAISRLGYDVQTIGDTVTDWATEQGTRR